jgi:hypothetical protein
MPGRPKQIRGFKLGTKSGDRFARKQAEIKKQVSHRGDLLLDEHFSFEKIVADRDVWNWTSREKDK